MRVVALFRVSTEKQAAEGASLDAQERLYHELAAKNGWETAGTFKGCESATQAATERQVLQRALACIRERQADSVWVIEQSRLTRGDELETALLLRELRERGVKVIVGATVRDLESIDESFMFGVQSLVDRAESQRIKERMGRGRNERAKQGKKNSGGPPYGYRNPRPGEPGRGTLQVVPEQAAVVRRAFELAAAGSGERTIAAKLDGLGVPAPRGGKWGKASIRRMLHNPAYIGVHASNVWVRDKGSRTARLRLDGERAIIVEGAHEAIVDRATWDAVRHRAKPPPTPTPRLLSGLLCVNGQKFHGDFSRSRAFYRADRREPGQPWLGAEAAESAVWDAFASLATSPEFVERLLNEARSPREQAVLAMEIEHLEDRLGKLRRRVDRLVEMRAEGDIDKATYRAKADEARQSIARVTAELADLRSRAVVLDGTHAERVVRAVQTLLAGRTRLTAEQKRSVLGSIVRRVEVTVQRTGAAQSRTERGWFSVVHGPKWTIQAVSFRLALPAEIGGVPENGCAAPPLITAVVTR